MKTKLLFIVNVDWFFLSHRLPIALEAQRNGFDVHLICKVTDKRALIESKGITLHDLDIKRSGTNPLVELRTLTRLFFICKMIRPNIIHSITIKPVIYGNLVSRILRIPRVSSISGLGYVYISQGWKARMLASLVSWVYKFALGNCEKVIFQNSSDVEDLRRISAVKDSQVVLIRGSGICLDDYVPCDEPEGPPVVMFMSRLLLDKGIREFVEAARLVKMKERARFVLVGNVDPDNPNSVTEPELNSWINEGVVEYWGFSSNPSETISKSNIIVLPSYREGLPKVLIEAAACARAVITTDVPGCRDAIEPSVTGSLVPVKKVRPLVDAMMLMLKNSDQRKDMAREGRKLAESSFDISDVVNTHINIYLNVMSRGKH
ncbi:glycosyltransferase family 4 protein [Vibrio sp. LaRot3]|uniref:glycosyltransferase family 4 protein n=1 Tax=Vibrio sp. LaRot3 TaxID=2998829 RepID=UPI0022CDE0C7|nr:glycosyltransferase family 4 protein [Vibrio sp. LaRot3]MDA0149403.1 glycosyltransferase family 4 protein [Vibrio sp. LaRot3]